MTKRQRETVWAVSFALAVRNGHPAEWAKDYADRVAKAYDTIDYNPPLEGSNEREQR